MIGRIALTFSIGLLILIACNKKDESATVAKNKTANQDVSENIQYYTCPMDMHKHINSNKPGDCPECGMKLVAVVKTVPDSADYYGCSMPEHSHVRADKPGKCPECNMQLMPMRLKSEAKM